MEFSDDSIDLFPSTNKGGNSPYSPLPLHLQEFDEDLLLDFDDDDNSLVPVVNVENSTASLSFTDLLLKSKLLEAIHDAGFENPSLVQNECIPQAILGIDMICQARSGSGKTAVFVLSILQQLLDQNNDSGQVLVLVICHTRELSCQVGEEFKRLGKHTKIKIGTFYGGVPIKQNEEILKYVKPQVIIGTPGRILDLMQHEYLKINNLKHFVIDECDIIMQDLKMRRDIIKILETTPKNKQVMMFSSTVPENTRSICKEFMNNPVEMLISDDNNLVLHGIDQYYLEVPENRKINKLLDLIETENYNLAIIFVKSAQRAIKLTEILRNEGQSASDIHSSLTQVERMARFQKFKNFKHKILVATDIFGRGIDIQRIDFVVNYDTPTDSDTYINRIQRAGRFGTKGRAITFIDNIDDELILEIVRNRFRVKINLLN